MKLIQFTVHVKSEPLVQTVNIAVLNRRNSVRNLCSVNSLYKEKHDTFYVSERYTLSKAGVR